MAALLAASVALIAAMTLVPGFPLGRPSNEGFASWDAFPESDSVHYAATVESPNRREPFYLALIEYQTEADVAAVAERFGLRPRDSLTPYESWADLRAKTKPDWFPLAGADVLYCHPQLPGRQYAANLWVDTDARRMVIERAWW